MNATFSELAHLAREITSWAEANGILGDSKIRPGYDERLIQDTFNSVSLRAATSALQDRRISYIGINENNSSVVIYTNKVLRKPDREALEKSGYGNCRVEFHTSGVLTSGNVPANSPQVPPYVQHKDKFYTCGSSVSVANEASAGTLGCLLTDGQGTIFGLSNNHVFAGTNYCEIGIQVIAPGQYDIRANALDPFTIGHLHKASPLIDGNFHIVDASTNVDAAIIKVSAPSLISSMQRSYYDTPVTTLPLSGNMIVEKVGRTTGRTTGVVTSYQFTPQPVTCNITVLKSQKIVYFQDYWGIISQAGLFSDSGDSGSLVTTVDSNNVRHAVGIVFAGGNNVSFVIPIDKVLSYFGLTLLSGHNI